ncbi:cutinase family protein [Corynebacterium bovis]
MGIDRVVAVGAGGRTPSRWAGSLRAGVAAVTVAVAVGAAGATAGAVSASPAATTTVGRAAAGGGQCVDVYALAVQGTGQSSPGADRFSDTGFLSGLFGTVNQQLSGAAPLGGSVAQARRVGESVFDAHRRVREQAGSGSAGGSGSSATTVGGAGVWTSPSGVRFAREYIPYEASFGGLGGVGRGSYVDSVEGAKKELVRRGREVLEACPATKLALVGYSQGADVVDQTAALIGGGASSIRPESVGVVAVFGSPRRRAGLPTIPGGADSPAGVPGASASAGGVAGLPTVTAPAQSGAGLLPAGDHITDYGRLTGKVANFCARGDLVCDTPVDASTGRALARVVSQTDVSGGDPFRALEQMTDALALTPVRAVATGINEDVRGRDLRTVSVDASMSISKRIEQAAARPVTPVPGDVGASSRPSSRGWSSEATVTTGLSDRVEPSTQPGVAKTASGPVRAFGDSSVTPGAEGAGDTSRRVVATAQDSLSAVVKLGLLGGSAVTAVARDVFTPEVIGQVATAGLADPAAGLGVLGTKVIASATKVVAPVGMKLAGVAFDLARQEVSDNAGLLQMATDVTYWNHFANHTSYNRIPVDAQGDSALDYVAAWMLAVAEDVHGGAGSGSAGVVSGSSAVPSATMTAATTTGPVSAGSSASTAQTVGGVS